MRKQKELMAALSDLGHLAGGGGGGGEGGGGGGGEGEGGGGRVPNVQFCRI